MSEPRIRAGCATDVGLKRSRNEDSVLMRPEAGLWAVADGMGGHGGGDIASRMTVEALKRFVDGEFQLYVGLCNGRQRGSDGVHQFFLDLFFCHFAGHGNFQSIILQ